MKNEKLSVLAILLVIGAPAFFFLVFRPLSKIPRPPAPIHYYPEGVEKYKDASGEEITDSVYHTIPNAEYQMPSGDRFELDSLKGNVYVANFFFASCPGICPVMTNQLERVQQAFIKDRNFRIISMTVDPDRDSLEALRAYAKTHGAISGRWIFLRAPKEVTYKTAKDGFYLVAKEDEDGAEAFVHSEKLTLVDYNGVIRGYYDGTDSLQVNKLMQDLVLVLRETEKNYGFRKNPKERGKLW
ncbi:MAG: SCO family protein [Chitinophagales bacterium]